ncbi:hypothetical protein T4B_9753 [Trichinella pseudospiralis]|uniref:Uncharacterized protein n=1 Tax=Trichinella pseudospiralis TaxID=6337 RepID=A0A0V1JFN9_TRIPS|nr:hypothetical protein T4B_9753 [Trichinella pseudospiralis]
MNAFWIFFPKKVHFVEVKISSTGDLTKPSNNSSSVYVFTGEASSLNAASHIIRARCGEEISARNTFMTFCRIIFRLSYYHQICIELHFINCYTTIN